MLYQWEVGGIDPDEVASSYWSLNPTAPDEERRVFATTLLHGVTGSLTAVDPLIAQAAEHWRLSRMAIVDRLILRLAVYEFLHRPETPRKVIINEALELARKFSTDEAVRFINGVLDAIRKKLEEQQT
jgi:N utilization substance protein B